MAYGQKYTVDFKSYQLRISKKDYVGSITELTAGYPACNHRWDKDDPIAPTKGSSLTATVIGVPLLDFYANNDNEFLGELYKGSDHLFSGYLVQDDCSEDIDDLIHPVSLSFTDNLGLLKSVSFGDALADISVTASKITLFELLKACITATGIALPVTIYSDLKEDNQDALTPFIAQTLIAKESFLKSEREYEDCYTVLEKVMSDLKCQILQERGKWVVKRCFEAAPKAFIYNSSFVLQSTSTYNNAKAFGKDQVLFPEYGYYKKIVRPFNVVKHTYDYERFVLLKNADLKDLGTLLNTYTSGTDTVNEYAFTDWFDSDLSATTATFFIRVVSDSLGNEKERYVVVKDDFIMSTAIEGDKGDRITFSLSFRTNVAQAFPGNTSFVIQLSDGTTTSYADEDGVTWKPTIGYSYTKNNDLTQWQSVTLTTARLPYSGLVKVFLHTATANPADETHYNDLRFQYDAYINESTKVVGQTHTNTQDIDIKNKEELDINIDDSPRNFISGTLFLNTLTGLLQARTTAWNTGKRLNEVITQEVKQWRSRARTITEGTLHGDVVITPLDTFTNPAFPNLKFVPGVLDIDYGSELCTGTMHEIRETGEAAVTSEYKFEYKYDTK